MIDEKERKRKAAERTRLMEKLNEKYDHGDGVDFILNAGENAEKLEPTFMSTGIMELDELLGGGWGRGTIGCVHGTFFTGKTGLALSTAAECAKRGEYTLYVCTEPPFPKQLAELVGVDMNYMDIITPQGYGEEVINSIEEMLFNKETKKLRSLYDLIIFDSINCLVPKSTLETFLKDGAEKDAQMARKAAMYTNMLERILGRGILRNGSVLLLIAQDRANMDANSAKYFPEKMSGPKAVGYDSKQIIGVSKKNINEKDKDGKTVPIGHDVNVVCEKNAITGKPGRCTYAVMYGLGVDDSASLVKKADEWGYILRDKDLGRSGYRIPLENGDWCFRKGIAEIRDRAKLDKDFKTLLKKELDKGKPKEPITSKGFDYEIPTIQAETVEETDEA